MSNRDVRRDCLHFRGDIPCAPHKATGVHCHDCSEYKPRTGRVLIIKLGAAGDVIRTTPLLESLRKLYQDHHFTWISQYPDLVPESVDLRLPLDASSILWARHTRFDILINLDKDREACALASEVRADRKFGFQLGKDGYCEPVDNGPAHEKYLTGVFDDLSRENTLSYLQEIFAICGLQFSGQEYVLDKPKTAPAVSPPAGKALIGLNTGCGGRWTSRLWPDKYWAALCTLLQENGYGVMLLGGPDEDARNQALAAQTGAYYPGTFSLRDFIGVMDRCDLVVSAVTMAMHIAIGLKKQLVLFNNIFNPREFELYGRGRILSPEQTCTCYFQPKCRVDNFCMETLRPETVLATVDELMETR
jgi:lipopolysaccharide heptosyltransferase III